MVYVKYISILFKEIDGHNNKSNECDKREGLNSISISA